MSKPSSPEPEDNLPFLEINDEMPDEWSMNEIEQTPTPSVFSSSLNSPTIESQQIRSPRPSSRPSLMQHPQFKIIVLIGGTLLTLMVLFRLPPILLFIAVFSVLRALFIPLALVGFIWWAVKQYTHGRR